MSLQCLGNESCFEVAMSAMVLPFSEPQSDFVVDHIEDDNLDGVDGGTERPNTFVEE